MPTGRFANGNKHSIFVIGIRLVTAQAATWLLQNVGYRYNSEILKNIETKKQMANKELIELTDQELLEEAKKLKSFSIVNAFFIGFLIGIIIFSIFKSTFGFLMLIPLYFIHKMINDPKNKRIKELEIVLKQRNLKQ